MPISRGSDWSREDAYDENVGGLKDWDISGEIFSTSTILWDSVMDWNIETIM